MKKVICFGSFDPLHAGHINFFSQAKELGDFLIVVVSRDENILREKGHKPSQSEQERLQAVKDCGLADKAILGDCADNYDVLDREAPDVIAVGYDQVIPEPLKNNLKKYNIVTLKPFKSEIYKSSKIKAGEKREGPIV